MAIKEGDTLPGATLIRLGADGPEQVDLAEKLEGRRVVIFGLPGAYTGTCTNAHVPSFIRTKGQFDEKGVDEIICLSVNDPFVLAKWAGETGAEDAGLTTLGDPEAAFTTAIGMDFTYPPAGLVKRSKRYAMLVENGVVKVLQAEDNPGLCDVSGGEALLEAI